MRMIVVCLVLLFAADSGFGRRIDIWNYRKMRDEADLVVIGKPIETKETAERGQLLRGYSFNVVGVSTEFLVVRVLRGDGELKRFVLHHYRLQPRESPANGPRFVSFRYDPKEPIERRCPNKYELFLKKEPDGRYAPVAGQVDPAMCSVKQLQGDSYWWDETPQWPVKLSR